MWALHNSIKGWTLYGLSEREVHLLIHSMTANELKTLSICEVSEKKWNIFESEKFSKIHLMAGKMRNDFPEPSLGSDQDYQESQAEYFIVKPKKVKVPRLHDRIDIEIQASIVGHSQQFNSVTVNLSEGGIYFKDLIPDWVSGYFIVVVLHQNQNFQIMCSLVEDQKIKNRVQIVSEESDPHFINYKRFLETLRSR